MQSLRTRRPSEARPQAQRKALQKPAKPAGSTQDSRKSRVDDKIKKRMSMRYANISSPTDAAAPSVPSVPIGARPKPQDELVREVDQVREDPKVVDTKLLDQDPFDAEAFLKAKLANSTEGELKSLQSSLQSYKDDTATDLQRNVFKNYAEFVLISKEISTLENDMMELKESLAEWKSMPSLLHIDESATLADRRRTQRSSVADLRVLYANQLQTLHSQIEGSSKFVPTTAGRHIIAEMDGISSLNPATYKVEHQVRFFLLNDTVLVAKKRRRRNGESGKMVAERCWPLMEMLVLDTKDTTAMSNVFKIRFGKETHVYRTELASDKKSLLVQFRQVAEELAEKKRKEREGEHERRKSVWDRGAALSFSDPDKVPPVPDWLSAFADKTSDGGAKEKSEKDARWVGDFADELTVAIALREWDDAVALVEQGEARLRITPSLATKLTPLTTSLTSALLHALTSSTRKSSVVHLISLLLLLHAGAAARTAFLAGRSETMRKRVRTIRFEGHVGMYVGDLSVVVFTGIKHTADWFLASFKENDVSSAFVEWAKEQIESYAEMFRKQVFGTDVDQEMIDECLNVTHSQSKKLLQEYGLDFKFLLDELLVPSPKNRQTAVIPPPIFSPVSKPKQTAPASTLMIATPVARTPISPRVAPLSPRPVPMSAGIDSSTSRPPRSARASPAPPPRSRDRPDSAAGQRAPPTPVPRRENMF